MLRLLLGLGLRLRGLSKLTSIMNFLLPVILISYRARRPKRPTRLNAGLKQVAAMHRYLLCQR